MQMIGVDQFVAWAATQEWPKMRAAHLDASASERAALMAAVERLTGRRWSTPHLASAGWWSGLVGEGSVSSRRMSGEVHPDALALFAVVQSLDELVPVEDVPFEELMSDIDLSLAPDERYDREIMLSPHADRAHPSPRRLVMAFAHMPRARRRSAMPDWCPDGVTRTYRRPEHGGKPALFVSVSRKRRVRLDDGTVIVETVTSEEPGLCARTQRALPGAYRRVIFTPDPMGVALARWEYMIWHRAMQAICDNLADGWLVSHRVHGMQASEKPWKNTTEKAA